MATREEKVRMKQERSLRRIQKRQEKDNENVHLYGSDRGVSWARRKSKGRVWECTMMYSECNRLGYCNGDC